MKNTLIFTIFGLFTTPGFSQNTVGGKKVIVPESEVNRQSAFLDAERERMLGNFDKALKGYKDFLLENPENDAAWYGLARTHIHLKDEQNALDAIRKAIEIDPANPWYQTYYGDLLEKNGRIKDAVKVYESLVKAFPQTPGFYQKQAYLLVLSGDPKGGLKALDKLENLTGLTEETASKKHMIYVGLGDNKKAAAELRKLADAFPEDIEYRHRLAEFYESMGDNNAARSVYQEILRRNPDDPVAKLAVLEPAKGSSNAVFVASLKPLFADARVSIDAKIKEILPFFSKIESGKDASLIENLLVLGTLLETAHSDDAKAWAISGDLHYYAGQSDKALAKYRKCMALNATVFSVWQNALEILSEQKNHTEMVKVAEQALDGFPNQSAAYLYYGMAAIETGKIEDGLTQLEQGLLMSGNNLPLRLELTDWIGQALLKKKDFTEAKSRLEAALPKGGDKHPGILERLGDACFQSGEGTRAIEFWQKANGLRRSAVLEQKIASGKM